MFYCLLFHFLQTFLLFYFEELPNKLESDQITEFYGEVLRSIKLKRFSIPVSLAYEDLKNGITLFSRMRALQF